MLNKEFEVRIALGTLDGYSTFEDIIRSTNMKNEYRLFAAKKYIQCRMYDGSVGDPKRNIPEDLKVFIKEIIAPRVDKINKWLIDFGINLDEWKLEYKASVIVYEVSGRISTPRICIAEIQMKYPLHYGVGVHFNMFNEYYDYNLDDIQSGLANKVNGVIEIDD